MFTKCSRVKPAIASCLLRWLIPTLIAAFAGYILALLAVLAVFSAIFSVIGPYLTRGTGAMQLASVLELLSLLVLVACWAAVSFYLGSRRWTVGAKWCCVAVATSFAGLFTLEMGHPAGVVVMGVAVLAVFFAADLGVRRRRLQENRDLALEDSSRAVESAHQAWKKL